MYIYALIDPITQETRYVGKTNDIVRRYREHIYSKDRETDKVTWIQSLRSNGNFPLIGILEVTGNNWRERERYWIADLQAQGIDLVNTTKGGDGPNAKAAKPIPTSFFALV